MAEPSAETRPIAGVPELYGSTTLLADDAPDPMEPQTYKAVCEFMGRNAADEFPSGHFDSEFSQFTPEELMVRQDLAKNKARWSDDYNGDRRRFLNQMHPIFALFYSHRLHTVSRQERLVVYVAQLFWVLLVALTWSFAGQCGEGLCSTVGGAGVGAGHPCVFPFTHKGKTYESCTTNWPGAPLGKQTAWCSTKTRDNGEHIPGEWGNCWCQRGDESEECWKLSRGTIGHRQIHAVLCCLAHHTGVAWFSKTFHIWDFDLGGSVYAALLNTIFALGSFQLMICGCVQRSTAFVRRFGELAGHTVFGVFSLLIMLPQPYLILYAYETHRLGIVLWVFLTGKIVSYTALTGVQYVAFHFIWGVQAEDKVEEDSDEKSRGCGDFLSKFHVTASQYEAFLLSRRKVGN